jgi:cellulose biosynthesis protein BcsQ
MALANTACYLAQKKRVLAIDWDLDAPGLEYYFSKMSRSNVGLHKGVLDFFQLFGQRSVSSPPTLSSAELIQEARPLDFIISDIHPNLSFMPSGMMNDTYDKLLSEFDWNLLHSKFPGLIVSFADYLSRHFDYILIDSRTGFSDIAGICTSIMPEKLVAVFTPNKQSLDGLRRVIQKATAYRRQSDDIRPLVVFPLPSRVDITEPALHAAWRYSQLQGYQPLFEKLFEDTYGLESCSLVSYFDEVQIQHVPRYSYGEDIAFLMERQERLSLSRSFEEFGRILDGYGTPWEVRATHDRGRNGDEARLEQIDLSWFESQRTRATKGLRELGFDGFSECNASLLRNRPVVDQSKLLEVARQSQMHAFGWPVGVILDNDPDSKPRPTSDGIRAEVSVPSGPLQHKIYDFWAWRRNGDFFVLQSFFEDDTVSGQEQRVVFFEPRMTRLVETLLYCAGVYQRLGIDDETPIFFSCRWTGLSGRTVRPAEPTRMLAARKTLEDEVATSVNVTIARIHSDIVGVVKQLLEPLFVLFDFLRFDDGIYKQIVETFWDSVARERTRMTGYRLDLDDYLLEVEQLPNSKWMSRVFEKGGFAKLAETTENTDDSAKLDALKYVLSRLDQIDPTVSDHDLLEQHKWWTYKSLRV